MVAISFSVFRDKVLSGEKRQTIRPMRKRPFKIGDKLELYWHMRRKDCKLLRRAVCLEEFKFTMTRNTPYTNGRIVREYTGGGFSLSFVDASDIARQDGFEDLRKMQDWFGKQYGARLPSLTFQVVRWGGG
jgi:hypothetical protein